MSWLCTDKCFSSNKCLNKHRVTRSYNQSKQRLIVSGPWERDPNYGLYICACAITLLRMRTQLIYLDDVMYVLMCILLSDYRGFGLMRFGLVRIHCITVDGYLTPPRVSYRIFWWGGRSNCKVCSSMRKHACTCFNVRATWGGWGGGGVWGHAPRKIDF